VNLDVEHLAAALRRETGPLLVLTGAGISAASGLATFRGTDPDAIWNLDVKVVATRDHFEQKPVESWQWFRRHFARIPSAHPNPAHEALASLESWWVGRGREFLVVTQNIDGLHAKAGSKRLVHVHGRADRVRCVSERCASARWDTIPIGDIDFEPFDRAPAVEHLPRCPLCESLLRPHALFFDELYTSHPDYQWHRVVDAANRMRALLCVGTSFSVGVTHHVMATARQNGVSVSVIDPRAVSPAECGGAMHLQGEAEIVLPELCPVLFGSD
jgi:NAD-dependent deacetylase